MAREMTPQDRAAAIVDKVKAELPPIWLGGRQRMLLEQEIAEALQATRRAALLEAREVVLAEVLEDIPDNEADEAYNLAIGHAAHALDRLAQEGS